MFNRSNEGKTSHNSDVLRGILFFQLIVVSQIIVIALLAMVVFFIKGFAEFFYWIVFGGAAVVGLTSFWVYRRFKKKGLKTVTDAIHSPDLQGRQVEVRVLGGLLSVKLGGDQPHSAALSNPLIQHRGQLEDPETVRIRELAELSRLLEKNLITPEEFKRSKARLYNE
jgi:hypothetical protein